MKVNALCIPSSTPYYKEWIANGYTKKDIYKEYILNNYVLPDVPSKLPIERQLILKSLVPVDHYQEDFISKIKDKFNIDALGAFFNNTFYFAENASKGTVAEEAFHAITQTLMTAEERQSMLKIGKALLDNRLSKEGKSLDQYVQEVSNRLGVKNNVIDYVSEEEVAKQFVNYYTSGRNVIDESAILDLASSLPFGEASYTLAKFLYNLFQKLKSLIGFGNDNRNNMLSMFERIKNGEFSNRKVLTNESAYNVPAYQVYFYADKNANFAKKYISPSIVQKLVANVAQTYSKYREQNTEIGYEEALTNAKNNWLEYLQKESPQSIEEIIILSKSYTQLKKDVLYYLASIKKKDELEEFLEELGEDDMGGLSDFDSSANERDFTYSKEMKNLILNSGKEVKYTNANGEEKFIYQTPNPAIIYAGLVRASSNALTQSERLQKMVKFASIEGNENSKIFIIDKILGDAVKGGVEYNGASVTSVDELKQKILLSDFSLQKLTLKDSFSIDNFNVVLNAFDLWGREMKILAFSNTTSEENNTYGNTLVFNSNQGNAQKVQFNNWINEYNVIKKSMTYDDFKTLLGVNQTDNRKKIVDSETHLFNNITILNKALNLNLSPEFLKQLRKLLSNEFSEISYDDIRTSKGALNSNFKILFNYLNDANNTDFPDLFNENGAEKSDIKSFFTAISNGNILFDESILENSFRNIENKTIYGFQWGTNTQRVVASLKDKNFLMKTLNGNPYIGQGNNPDKNFFIKNPILRKLRQEAVGAKASTFLSKIVHFSPDGLKETTITRKGKNKISKVDPSNQAVSFGDFKFREFATAYLGLFIENSEVVKDSTGKDIVFAPVTFGQNEASKIMDFATIPVFTGLVDINGNLTPQAIGLVQTLIDLEKERIDSISQLLTEAYKDKIENSTDPVEITVSGAELQRILGYSTNVFEKYHTGKLVAKDGKIDLLGSYKVGKKSIKTNIRGLDVTKNLKGFYSLKDYVENSEIDINERFLNIFNQQLKTLVEKEVIGFDKGVFQPEASLIPTELYSPVVKTNEDTGGRISKGEALGFNYTGNETKDVKNNLSATLLNMWLGSTYLNQIRVGDTMLNYKNDLADPMKRNRTDNAAGSSIATELGNQYYGLGPVSAIKFIVEAEPKAISDVNKKELELADAQGRCGVAFHLKTDYGLGRLTPSKYELYKEFYEGLESSLEDIEDLGHYHNVKKTVTANGSVKGKFSMHTLNKPQTSYKQEIDAEDFFAEAYLTDNYTQINSVEQLIAHLENGGKLPITKQRNGSFLEVSWNLNSKAPKFFVWKQSPGHSNEKLHTMRMTLDGWRKNENNQWVFVNQPIDFIMPPSASKAGTRNVVYDYGLLSKHNDFFVQEQDANNYKLQVENPAGKEKIFDPTQELEIAINEISGNIEFTNADGTVEVLPATKIIELFQDYMASRDKNNYTLAVNQIFDKIGPKYQYLSEKIKNALETSGADAQTINMVQSIPYEYTENGVTTTRYKMEFNQNIPLIKEKFIQLYFKHFSAGVLQNKVPGDALAMISPNGFSQLKKIVKHEIMYKGKPKTIYSWEVIKKSDPNYASIVDKWNENKYELNSKRNEDSNKEKKSYIYDIRNTLVGDGSKDEVSRKLAEWYKEGEDVYFTDDLRHNKPRIENGKIVHFVSETLMPRFYKESGIDAQIKYMFGVRIPTQDKQSSVNIEWVDELPIALGNSIVVPKEVAQLAGSDFDIDKIYVHKLGGDFKKGKFVPYENTYADYVKYMFKSDAILKSELINYIKNDLVLNSYKEEIAKAKEIAKRTKKSLDSYFQINPELKADWDKVSHINDEISESLKYSSEVYSELSALTKDIPQEIKDLQQDKSNFYKRLSQARKDNNKQLISELEDTLDDLSAEISEKFRIYYEANPNKGSNRTKELAQALNREKALKKNLEKERTELEEKIAKTQEANKEILEDASLYFKNKKIIEIYSKKIKNAEQEKQTALLLEFGLPSTPEEYAEKMPKGHSGFINNQLLKLKQVTLSSDKVMLTNGERGIYDSPATIDQLTDVSETFYVTVSDEETLKEFEDKGLNVTNSGNNYYSGLTNLDSDKKYIHIGESLNIDNVFSFDVNNSSKEDFSKFIEYISEEDGSLMFPINLSSISEEKRGYVNEAFKKLTDKRVYPFLDKSKKSIFDKDRGDVQTYSPINFMFYQDAVQTGKGSIAYGVNANLLGIVANRLGLKHNRPLIFKELNGRETILENFSFYSNDEKRTFDIISTIITATTDEAKEGQLARHNIGMNGLKAISLLLLHGVSLGHAISILQNPLVKRFEELSINKPIKTAKEKNDNKFYDSHAAIYKAVTNEDYEFEEKQFYINEKDILNNTEDKEVLASYIFILQSYESLSQLVTLIKGKKGFGQEIESLEASYDKIRSMDIDNDLVSSGEKTLYNFREAIVGNPKAVQLLGIRDYILDQHKKTVSVFTNRLPIFSQLKNRLMNTLSGGKKEFYEKINAKIDIYLIGKIIQEFSNNPELQLELLNKDKLTSELVKGSDTIINQLLASNEEVLKIVKNEFKLLPGDSKARKPFNYIDKIALVQQGRISDEKQVVLTDIINTIANMDKELANNIVRYFAVKDGFQFKSNSISKAIPTHYFGEVSKILDYLLSIEGTETYKVFADKAFNEIGEMFYTSIQNKKFLPRRKGKETLEEFFGVKPLNTFREIDKGRESTINLVFQFTQDDNTKVGKWDAFVLGNIVYKKLPDNIIVDDKEISTFIATYSVGNQEASDTIGFNNFVALEDLKPSVDFYGKDVSIVERLHVAYSYLDNNALTNPNIRAQIDKVKKGLAEAVESLKEVDNNFVPEETTSVEESTPEATVGNTPFKLKTLDKVPQAEKVKAVFKAENSIGFIGFGKPGSSTDYYAQQYREANMPVNPETYKAGKVYFASLNGDGFNREKTLEEIKKALDSDAKVLLDSESYIKKSEYNKEGEGWMFSQLKSLGYQFKNLSNKDSIYWYKPVAPIVEEKFTTVVETPVESSVNPIVAKTEEYKYWGADYRFDFDEKGTIIGAMFKQNGKEWVPVTKNVNNLYADIQKQLADKKLKEDSGIVKANPFDVQKFDTLKINGVSLDIYLYKNGKKIPAVLNSDQENAVKQIINWAEQDNTKPISLVGKAGTGKTTVIRLVKDYFRKKAMDSVIITPTHKAGKVASALTNGDTSGGYKTVASAFYGNKPGPVENVWLFDESSMINDSDLNTIKRLAEKRNEYRSNIITIFMGDNRQLPPVGSSEISKTLQQERTVELTEVMRFAESGAIFKLADHLAENLQEYKPVVQYPSILRSETDTIETVGDDNVFVSNYVTKFKENDLGTVKMVVYGNGTAERRNNSIRNKLFGIEASFNKVLKDDMLVGSEGWSTLNVRESPMLNSSDYVVTEVKDGASKTFYPSQGNPFIVKGQSISYLEFFNGKLDKYASNIISLDVNDPDNFEMYNYIATNIINMKMLPNNMRYNSTYNNILDKIEKSGIYIIETKYAKVLERDINEKPILVKFMSMSEALADLRNKNPNMTEDQALDLLRSDNAEKDLYEIPQNFAFGYAITAHKAQGSTYKHVFVDEKNMSFKDDKRKMYKNKQFFGYEANSMRYVGFSRPTDSLTIFTEKPIGDKLILSNGKEYSSETITFDKLNVYTQEQKDTIVSNLISQFKDKNYTVEDAIKIINDALEKDYEGTISKINNCYL